MKNPVPAMTSGSSNDCARYGPRWISREQNMKVMLHRGRAMARGMIVGRIGS
jgi:hypothetical protein